MQITKAETEQISKLKKPAMKIANAYVDPEDGEVFEIELDTPGDYKEVAGDLVLIKSRLKEIEDLKKGITKPIREALDKVNEHFKQPIEIMKSVESAIKKGMSGYIVGVREAAQECLEEALANSDTAGIQEAQSYKEPTITGIQVRNNQTVIIEDETKIPPEFLTVDKAKVKKAAKAGIEIPGVRLIETPSIAAVAK